jgi:hypothetical protein
MKSDINSGLQDKLVLQVQDNRGQKAFAWRRHSAVVASPTRIRTRVVRHQLTNRISDVKPGGKMESEWILGRLDWGVWIGFDWLRTGTVAVCCECGDEPSGSCATELVS